MKPKVWIKPAVLGVLLVAAVMFYVLYRLYAPIPASEIAQYAPEGFTRLPLWDERQEVLRRDYGSSKQSNYTCLLDAIFFAWLDESANVSVCEIRSGAMESEISYSGYCGLFGLGFDKLFLLVDGESLTTHEQVRDLVRPIESEKEAVAFAVYGNDDVEPRSTHVRRQGEDFVVRFLEPPSACDCGFVTLVEKELVVSKHGELKSESSWVRAMGYQAECLG
ncbi:MAG: hypothetical protein HC945_02690 [Nitrosarchaeum sp.]|nr:hypothetical protein [Nitrosarchaeum sp.]